MPKKPTDDNKKKASGRKGALAKFAFVFFISAWMFTLGILVGRGTAPVEFDMEKIEAELVALREAVAKSEEKRYPIVHPPKTEDPQDLKFYEALKKKGSDEKLPEESLVKAAQEKKKIAEQMIEPVRVEIASEKKQTEELSSAPIQDVAPSELSSSNVARPDPGLFTIQVSAVKDLAFAKKEVQRMAARGYHAYTVTVDIPGKGVWHRVRIGSFESREAAQKTLESLKIAGIKAILVKK